MRSEVARATAWAATLIALGCGGGAAGTNTNTNSNSNTNTGGGTVTTSTTTTTSGTSAPREHVGLVDRAAIEADLPAWVTARESATVDATAAAALASVPPGAEVDVVLGTWCGDSRREVSRLWKAIDAAGGTLPFAVRLIGVDRAKEAPDGLIDGMEIRYVPTIIVRRGGREVGRIIESAPNGIERELLALLRGERRGVISGRTDLE